MKQEKEKGSKPVTLQSVLSLFVVLPVVRWLHILSAIVQVKHRSAFSSRCAG